MYMYLEGHGIVSCIIDIVNKLQDMKMAVCSQKVECVKVRHLVLLTPAITYIKHFYNANLIIRQVDVFNSFLQYTYAGVLLTYASVLVL